MTLRHQLQAALSQLAPFASDSQLVEIDHAGQHVACQLVALDSLACSFTRLSLRCDFLAGMTTDQLKKTAERLSTQLTYLLEPISPIETDAQGCVVQLRSSPPQKDEDRTSYYELLVSRTGEMSLCRFERIAGQSRQSVAAHVTREVLYRLVGDFSAAAK
jgi:hypothetical protein